MFNIEVINIQVLIMKQIHNLDTKLTVSVKLDEGRLKRR